MSDINANYPIIRNGDYKDPVGSVTAYSSVHSELLTHPFELKPIIGQLTEVAGKPRTLKGFDLVILPAEPLGIHIPPRTDYGGMENIISLEHQLKVIERNSGKEAFRKQVLLEVIQSIAQL